MQTRKCQADANANAGANRIRTKNNMFPSPLMGDINTNISVREVKLPPFAKFITSLCFTGEERK